MDDRDQAFALVPVSRETRDRLEAYVALLRKWQETTNLVAPSTLPLLWTRHVADSLQLLTIRPEAQTWLDIGSGGGFPGIVIACALADYGKGHIHLVERNTKKVAFLREALRVTGGAGEVHLIDIADCARRFPPAIDVVTARAVAPLAALLDMAQPWLAQGATGLFPKGQDVDQELRDTAIYGSDRYILHPSITGNGTIIELIRRLI